MFAQAAISDVWFRYTHQFAFGLVSASRAAPDGYTLVMVASTLTSLRIARPDARLDPINDLAPITEVVAMPNVLVVHPSLPIGTVADLIAFANRQPGVLSYASAGLGSNPHVAMELLKARAGIDVVHVPYNGVAPRAHRRDWRTRAGHDGQRRLGETSHR
jgi:tripartite-type tricarboxylate transporter receptor subunit TctC